MMKQRSEAQSVVFVVDDDASMREALKSLFRSVGLHVEAFASGLEFLQSQRADVASLHQRQLSNLRSKYSPRVLRVAHC